MKIRLQFSESNILDILKNKPEVLSDSKIDYNLDYFNSSMSLLEKENELFYYTTNVFNINDFVNEGTIRIGGRWFIGGRCCKYTRCVIYKNIDEKYIPVSTIISDKLTDNFCSNIQNIEKFDTTISNIISELFNEFDCDINDIIF